MPNARAARASHPIVNAGPYPGLSPIHAPPTPVGAVREPPSTQSILETSILTILTLFTTSHLTLSITCSNINIVSPHNNGYMIMLYNTDTNFAQAAINELEALRTRRQQLNDQINELMVHRDQLNQQESALQQFLSAAGVLPNVEAHARGLSTNETQHTDPEGKARMRHRLDPELADLVFNILDKRKGHQMHYKEIVQEVAATGWPFTDNQSSREAWVNRVLNRDGRFIRPSKRGRYSLKKYYPNVTRSVGERQRMVR